MEKSGLLFAGRSKTDTNLKVRLQIHPATTELVLIRKIVLPWFGWKFGYI